MHHRRNISGGFQPTRPLRGATILHREPRVGRNISTHAPLAGRDLASPSPRRTATDFNPRAPCGARRTPRAAHSPQNGFQPTRPLRGATFFAGATPVYSDISTHAPLAGRDRQLGYGPRRTKYFNPRAPCGARLFIIPQHLSDINFNPRAPCGARRRISCT